jgi:glutamate-5-semialdehyde dehydrogenase
MALPLERLIAGMPIVYGGNRITLVSDELAAAFTSGDRLVVVPNDGTILHVPAAEHELVDAAMTAASSAFASLGAVSDDQITGFYDRFAQALADDAVFALIAAANAADVDAASRAGRSITRLELSDKMRADMIAGLHVWRDAPSSRDTVVETVQHPGWRVEQRRAGVGVVGFVFEGRPNVFADATGVLRSGNTVVFRIGSDALGTARAMARHALVPALDGAGIDPGAVMLLDSPSRATGWALFAHPQLALAVARGSGQAVAQLGAVARQAGVPASLHGTGGAWIVAGVGADAHAFRAAVLHSLDRKVCNTLNVCCVVRSRAEELVPVFIALSSAAGRRDTSGKLHVATSARAFVPPEWFTRQVTVRRADGEHRERQAEVIAEADLGTEWEWEHSPEVSLVVVDDVGAAVRLFNTRSPRLVASLISDNAAEHDRFWATIDAPFVGNGFTRWVDGQFALGRPELGLSNWHNGRLFGRGAVLSGDSVFTIRTRVVQTDPDLHR